jgi:O-antigen ligase
MLLGFGVNGHYRSGASVTYRDQFIYIVRNPEFYASMHNSFLQQLFDGGILGWLLLAIAAYWASARLSRRRRDWGNAGSSAIVAMTALLLTGMTEVSLAPGPSYDSFWLLFVLVGVACQATGRQSDGSDYTDRGQNATTQNTPSAGGLRSTHHSQSTHDDAFSLDQDQTRSTSFEKSVSMKGGAS